MASSSLSTSDPAERSAVVSRWWAFAFCSLLLWLTGSLWLFSSGEAVVAISWSLGSALPLAYVLIRFVLTLQENVHPETGQAYRTLGLPTWVTAGRGVFIALMAGFIMIPADKSPSRWLPAAFYLLAGIGDFLDGYIARRTGHVTRMGGRLDVAYDNLGICIATLLGVSLGRLPAVYLLLGFASYLFFGGLRLRNWAGLPTFMDRLRPTPPCRGFFGIQVAFVGIALLPVVDERVTHFAAPLLMLPNLLLFLRDWLVTTGHLDMDSKDYRQFARRVWSVCFDWAPMAFRVLMVGALVTLQTAAAAPMWCLVGLIGIGVLPRVSACLIFLVLAFGYVGTDISPMLLLSVLGVMLFGGGKLSLWSAEKRFMWTKVGGARPPEATAELAAG